MPLSEKAKANKNAYNVKRNKEINKQFVTNLKKEEYAEIVEYINSIGMNKAQFVRWAYNKLKVEGGKDVHI